MIWEEKAPKKAALYVRVSTEEQAKEGYSIPAQIETLQQYCQLYGMETAGIYRDLGLSGKNMQERPALLELLQDAGKRQFDCVLVWKVSRLSRNLKDLLLIVDELQQNQIAFISYSERFDTSTPAGRMTMQLLGSIAEFERSSLIDNVRLGLSKRARSGQWTNNHVYGYDNRNKKLVPNPEEAAVVRQIFSLYLEQGMSVSHIADFLNVQGFETKRRNFFSRDAVYRILTNPVYCGFVRHNIRKPKLGYLVQGVHPSLIEQEMFEAVQKKLGGRVTLPRDSGRFLLSGLLKCPGCGNTMKGSTSRYKDRQYHYYKCSRYDHSGCAACSYGLIKAQEIELQVMQRLQLLQLDTEMCREITAAVVQRIQPPKASSPSTADQQIVKQQKLLKLQYEKYFQLFEAGSITKDQLSQRLQVLNQKSAQLQAYGTKQPLEPHVIGIHPESDTVMQWLHDFPVLLQNMGRPKAKQLLHTLIEEITLSPDSPFPHIRLRFPCAGKTEL